MKKLIIWDFDGVISDTEKLWLETRRQMLNEKFGLNWDFETANQHMGGMSDKTKRENLDKLGIITDNAFWDEALERDIKKMACGIKVTEGIVPIFNNQNFAQCIATGGIFSKTILKIKAVGIEKYIPADHIFTADMVEHGKPEPDLFLLAAEKMGYKAENCIVIEDSVAGMTAGLKAGMTVVAFLGCDMNNNEKNIEKVKSLGIKHIFFDMKEIEKFLIDFTTT
uniref:Hydrolase n=1 Tax=uncultured Alphaproteobacteria bacterium TaxID=91750 RepID=A0A6M4NNB2_9PROT|nr:hydrolase [uncultured Alphaproteobacteria bacterium]